MVKEWKKKTIKLKQRGDILFVNVLIIQLTPVTEFQAGMAGILLCLTDASTVNRSKSVGAIWTSCIVIAPHISATSVTFSMLVLLKLEMCKFLTMLEFLS